MNMINREELRKMIFYIYIINKKIIKNIGGLETSYEKINYRLEPIIYSCEYFSEFKLNQIIYIFYHLLKNHIFNDGNKRTAWIVLKLFLYMNNIDYKNDIDRDFNLILNIINNKYAVECTIKLIEDIINEK